MPQARDEAGNIWEVDAQGNPVRLLQAASQQMPADPKYTYEGPKAAADAARAANQASASELDRPLAESTLRERELAIREREIALAEAEAAKAAETQTAGTKDLRQRLRTGNILETIQAARMIARRGGTGYESLMSPIPQTAARELQSELAPIMATLAFDRLQEMRDESKTGGALGNVSERELDLLGAAVASLDTGVDTKTFLDRLDRVERHFVGSQMALSGIDPDSEDGLKVFREYGVKFGNQDDGGPKQLGFDERFATDRDKQFATLAQSMFDKGATADDMQAIAQKFGYGRFDDQALQGALEGRSQGRAVNINAPNSGLNDPSIYERAMHNIGASPVGSYFGGAANALTFGGLDELRGIAQGDTLSEAFSGQGVNTAQANLTKNLQADAHPGWSTFGNLSGGVLGAMATGGLAGGAGRGVATFAPKALLGDAIYGSAYGAGQDNESRLRGAGTGAVEGAAGGALGRGVLRQFGNAVGGVGGDAQLLRERGVTMTPGQLGESSGGFLGKMLKRREDRFAGYSGIGDAIGAAQSRGVDQFNRAAFRDGLGIADAVPTELGEEAIDQARPLVGDAYNRALGGRILNVDNVFARNYGSRVDAARAIPNIGEEAAYGLNRSVPPFVGTGGQMPSNQITGHGVQNMMQELGRRGASLRKSQSSVGPDAADVLRDASGDVIDLANRQAPDLAPQLANANTAYRNLNILEDAVAAGMNTNGRFTPAQLGQAARRNAKNFGRTQATTQRPFFELQRAGQNILPSKIADSGTAGRQAAGDSLGGIIASALRNARAPMYSEPALEVINNAALLRSPELRKAGEAIRRNAYVGGLFGAPMLVYQGQN